MLKTAILTQKMTHFVCFCVGMVISFTFYNKKNKATPTMVINVPMTSFTEIFCLWMSAYGTMISTGVSAIRVEAMPALAYCTAMSESDTPRKGPKIVVKVAKVMPFLSWIALPTCGSDLVNAKMRKKPAKPAMARMQVPANGIILVMACGASEGMDWA